MSSSMYEKNRKNLEKKHGELFERIDSYQQKEEKYRIGYCDNPDGQLLIQVEKNGIIYHMNSLYREDERIDAWYQQYRDTKRNSVVHFFGMTPIAYLKKLAKELDNSVNIIIYEPSLEIFQILMEHEDLSFLADGRCGLVIGETADELFALYLSTGIDYLHLMQQICICAPNYELVFSEEYKEYTRRIKKYMETRVIDRNTEIRFSEEITYNVLSNIKYICNEYTVDDLARKFREKEKEGVPAIVVAAGPSLNQNIEDLKAAEGKAFIIATDTASKPLFNHGIAPDIVVTVDPSKPMVLFDKPEVLKVPILFMDNSNREVVSKHQGKKFFSGGQTYIVDELFGKYEKEYDMMPTGGSVAHNAFTLAEWCGFKTIILIGQDLAYPGNRTHADGTFKDKMEQKDMSGSFYLDVEDIHGNPIRTSQDFKYYLEWFESKIKELEKSEGLHVIDATEGGAKIHGAELMTLKDAIARECNGHLDAAKIIDSVEPAFTAEERKEIGEYLRKLPEDLSKAQKNMKKGIELYDKLGRLFQRNQLEGQDFYKATKAIKRVNRFMETEIIITLLTPYIKLTDYQVQTAMWQEEDSMEAEGINIAKNGKKMLEEYQKAAELLKNDIEKLGEDFGK